MDKVKRADGRLIFALILIIAGVLLRIFMPSYGFISYTLWALALVVIYYRILKAIKPRHPKPEKILNKIMSYGIILFCMVFAITQGAIYYGSEPSEPVRTDYAIVLGAGLNGTQPSKSLQYRLNAALSWLNEYPDTACIVTGCQGKNEVISEAEAMYNWLVDHGISSDRVIKEEKARNTKENIAYSLEMIESSSGKKPEAVTIITESFHMLRSTLIAKNMGAKAVSVPARTELPLLNINYCIREAFAMWKYLLLG